MKMFAADCVPPNASILPNRLRNRRIFGQRSLRLTCLGFLLNRAWRENGLDRPRLKSSSDKVSGTHSHRPYANAVGTSGRTACSFVEFTQELGAPVRIKLRTRMLLKSRYNCHCLNRTVALQSKVTLSGVGFTVIGQFTRAARLGEQSHPAGWRATQSRKSSNAVIQARSR
jgi:hypothetical protein